MHRARHPRPGRAQLGSFVLDWIEVPADRDEDRIAFAERDGMLRMVLADGAGGMTGGALAATFAVAEALVRSPDSETVRAIDRALADRGQTTLVTLQLDLDVRGASVGDSRAWARSSGAWSELTEGQARKPLVGSGRSVPRAFAKSDVDCVVVASDGLTHYLSEAELLEGLAQPDLLALVDRVRLPSGTLRDDVSLLVARRRSAFFERRGEAPR